MTQIFHFFFTFITFINVIWNCLNRTNFEYGCVLVNSSHGGILSLKYRQIAICNKIYYKIRTVQLIRLK